MDIKNIQDQIGHWYKENKEKRRAFFIASQDKEDGVTGLSVLVTGERLDVIVAIAQAIENNKGLFELLQDAMKLFLIKKLGDNLSDDADRMVDDLLKENGFKN